MQHIRLLRSLDPQRVRRISILFQIGDKIIHDALHIFAVHLYDSFQLFNLAFNGTAMILPVKELTVTEIFRQLHTRNLLQLQPFSSRP